MTSARDWFGQGPYSARMALERERMRQQNEDNIARSVLMGAQNISSGLFGGYDQAQERLEAARRHNAQMELQKQSEQRIAEGQQRTLEMQEADQIQRFGKDFLAEMSDPSTFAEAINQTQTEQIHGLPEAFNLLGPTVEQSLPGIDMQKQVPLSTNDIIRQTLASRQLPRGLDTRRAEDAVRRGVAEARNLQKARDMAEQKHGSEMKTQELTQTKLGYEIEEAPNIYRRAQEAHDMSMRLSEANLKNLKLERAKLRAQLKNEQTNYPSQAMGTYMSAVAGLKGIEQAKRQKERDYYNAIQEAMEPSGEEGVRRSFEEARKLVVAQMGGTPEDFSREFAEMEAMYKEAGESAAWFIRESDPHFSFRAPPQEDAPPAGPPMTDAQKMDKKLREDFSRSKPVDERDAIKKTFEGVFRFETQKRKKSPSEARKAAVDAVNVLMSSGHPPTSYEAYDAVQKYLVDGVTEQDRSGYKPFKESFLETPIPGTAFMKPYMDSLNNDLRRFGKSMTTGMTKPPSEEQKKKHLPYYGK